MIFIYVISTKLVDIDFSSLFPSYEKRQYAASNWFFLSCWCTHREWLRWLHCIGAAKKQAWWELHDSFKLPHAELSHQRTCVSISIYSLVFEMLPCWVVINTVQLYSRNPELRIFTGSDPARGVSGSSNYQNL